MSLVYNILQMRVLNTNVMWFINHKDLLYIAKYLCDTHFLNELYFTKIVYLQSVSLKSKNVFKEM